jgi:hypothetical protein
MAVGGRSGGPGGKTNVCAGDAAPVLAPTGPKNGSRDVLRVEAVPGHGFTTVNWDGRTSKLSLGAQK